MMERRSGNELRAGLFVLAGLSVLIAAIFLLGQKSALFTRNTRLYVNFVDISGLVVGAPVRLAGLDVGAVESIAFPEDLSEKRARVMLAIQTRYMPRIRDNSRAIIDSNGLLGDKIVNISMGDPSGRRLQDGDELKTGEALTFEALSGAIHDVILSVRGVTEGVNEFVGDMRESGVKKDITTISRALAGILSEVQQGKGLAHELVYDPVYARHFSAILVDVRDITSNTRTAMARLEGILKEVESGDGTLHEVLYGPGGKQAIAQLEMASREITEVVREVREGNGLVHTLVYEQGHTNFLRELNEAAITLNRLTQEVDQGRGTVGGLLKDPTVYEDLKTVLGNVKRNVLFKALVRFAIEQDDLRKVENAPAVVPTTETTPATSPAEGEGAVVGADVSAPH